MAAFQSQLSNSHPTTTATDTNMSDTIGSKEKQAAIPTYLDAVASSKSTTKIGSLQEQATAAIDINPTEDSSAKEKQAPASTPPPTDSSTKANVDLNINLVVTRATVIVGTSQGTPPNKT